MSISFAGFPTVQYIGAVYSEPMQIASGRIAGRAVPLSFNWAAYGVGTSLPAIQVNVNLQANAGQAAPLLDRIRSIYIDNTGNNYPVYVQFPDTGFTVTAQAYSAGWYPVFSNAFILNVAVTGFDSQNNMTELDIFVTNALASPYTDIAFQSELPLQLASPNIGGGASLTDVFAIGGLPAGSNYNNGNLSISGGGGTGASAQGTLDQFGRFTFINFDAGAGFTGIPVVEATGGQTVPTPFSLTTINPNAVVSYNNVLWQYTGAIAINCAANNWSASAPYDAGNQVNDAGSIYYCLVPHTGGDSPPSSPGVWEFLGTQTPMAGQGWLSSGTAPLVAAEFSATLGVVTTAIASAGYGLLARGDQTQSFFSGEITGTGTIINNLFGSPFSTGFIFLKDIFVDYTSGAADVNTFEIISSPADYVPYAFGAVVNGNSRPLNLQDMNAVFDATQTWSLNCTAWAANCYINLALCWTYSLVSG